MINPINKKHSGVILDFDGLLADTEDLFLESWNKALAIFGKKMSKGDYSLIRGKDPTESSRFVVTNYDLYISPQHLLQQRNSNLRSLMQHQNRSRIMPGVCEFLERVHKGKLPMALASNSDRDYIQMQLEKLGFVHFFSDTVCRDDVKNGKPAPDVYLRAAQLLDLQPTDCLVFEDSMPGAMAGQNAGMDVILINKLGVAEFNTSELTAHYDTFLDFLGDYSIYL